MSRERPTPARASADASRAPVDTQLRVIARDHGDGRVPRAEGEIGQLLGPVPPVAFAAVAAILDRLYHADAARAEAQHPDPERERARSP